MKFLFANLLSDGGPLFMYTTLIALIISIVLIALILVKGDTEGKKTDLVKHISLFALVWGFLGFFIGFISALDIFKTSLEVSNVNDDLMVNADGKNIMNYINDNTIQNENLFWRKDKMATVRSGNYKLIRLNDTSTVLYNIENNYFEDLDLKFTERSIHDSLFNLLSAWEDRLIDPNWIENKDWNIVTEMIYEDLMANKNIRAVSPKDLN